MYSKLQDHSEYPGMSQPIKPAPPPPYNNLNGIYPEIGPTTSTAPAPAPAPLVAPMPTIISVHNVASDPTQPPGPKPIIMTCPQCRCRGKSRINTRPSLNAHLACLLLSWTLCCCCVPYYMSSCRNVDHYCQVCDAFVGKYSA